MKHNQAAILGDWLARVAETYPAETAKFLLAQKDPFANPVGGAVAEGLAAVLAALAGEPPRGEAAGFLEQIIRIRAIQDFCPSAALAFLPGLKTVLLARLGKEIDREGLWREFLEFTAELDRLLLQAVDLYVGCREKVFSLKADETRLIYHQALKNSGILGELSEPGPRVRMAARLGATQTR